MIDFVYSEWMDCPHVGCIWWFSRGCAGTAEVGCGQKSARQGKCMFFGPVINLLNSYMYWYVMMIVMMGEFRTDTPPLCGVHVRAGWMSCRYCWSRVWTRSYEPRQENSLHMLLDAYSYDRLTR